MQKSTAMNYTAHYDSPLGGITLASDGVALTGLWFEGQKHYAAKLDPQHRECDDLSVFAETKRWLDSYFSGQVPDFTPKLAMRATPFRQAIWEILLTIPYGKTVTYGEIARQYIEMCYGSSLPKHHMSAQAVGGAVGHNPISLIIPCHRVIGANGSLTGYAGGVERKKCLLELERGKTNSL